MHAIDHIKSLNLSKAVIIGKGPSCELFDQDNYKDWLIITINDASILASGENVLNHFIDLEALNRSKITGTIVAPVYMHIKEIPSPMPALHGLAYDLSTSPRKEYVNRPVIQVRTRSSEACLDLVGHCGIKEVHFYGVNGGLSYGKDFKNLERLKPNEAHDMQFKFLQELTRKHRINVTYF
jgi:hypothetical protein